MCLLTFALMFELHDGHVSMTVFLHRAKMDDSPFFNSYYNSLDDYIDTSLSFRLGSNGDTEMYLNGHTTLRLVHH